MTSTNKSKEFRYTPTPNIVFGKLLDEIEDINNLKFILRIIWMINQVKRVPKYITIKEITSDKILYPIIYKESVKEIETACISMIQKPSLNELLMCHQINENGSHNTIVALNTSRNKAMLFKIQQIDQSDSVFQSTVDIAEETSNIFKLYEDNIGVLNPIIADELKAAENTYPHDWVSSAFKEAVLRNKRSWQYIKTILENWYREGKTDGRIGGNSKKSRYGQYFRR